ncbi:MAG: phosphoribosylamine--glycine ligase [Bacteroidales bacterium]|nr:phosphoribosylamine--glycine ligase [Bacteroidales bacterium]
MNVLIIGSGGREHTLAWKISQSPMLGKLYIAPGNGGTQSVGENVPIAVSDFEGIRRFVLDNQIGMVVVGPEQPLVDGIVDFFKNDLVLNRVPVIGPEKRGALLEGSKDYANRFMDRYGIPTAKFRSFTSDKQEEALAYLRGLSAPYVLKADGLAAGKGVVIAQTLEEAEHTLKEFFEGKFGEASKTVVIEEFLEGRELSAFILTDGKTYKVFPPAKDYKRAGEKDTGPNTGGMGALSPVPYADEAFLEKIRREIIEPTMNGLKEERIDYRGFLYFGLMKVGDQPYVIEYNVRMGDPEAQVVIPRMHSGLLEAMDAVAHQRLDSYTLELEEDYAATVILASQGYPGKYEKGKPITLPEEKKEVQVFHAGTKKEHGKLLTAGGRVMAVTALAAGFSQALSAVYREIENIDFEGKYYRKDIGHDL